MLEVNLDSEGCFTFAVEEVEESTRCIECGRRCKTDLRRLNMCRDCEMNYIIEELPKELPPQVEEATE